MIKYLTLFLLSLLATSWIYKKVLRIALMKNIVDNPDARKLQGRPVPVLGGVAVFWGMLVSLVVCNMYFKADWILVVLGLMTVMLYVGTLDDILSLTPYQRFFIEILAIFVMITCNDNSINNFHGLWDIWWMPEWASMLVTIIACVGIMNAINMIDGVNGLCSGYCIVICLSFGIIFWQTHNFEATAMAIIAIGALIPFFFHNVFGRDSKMFLGDGGSLLMGITMSVFVVELLKDRYQYFDTYCPDLGVVPLALALLAIPVFDTLRVMTMRLIRGNSPFSSDRTHLHHLFFDYEFSHLGTTALVIGLNVLVILVWTASYYFGASIEVQLYVVASVAFMVTFVFYPVMRCIERKGGRLYESIKKLGRATHIGHTKGFMKLTSFLDRNCNYETESES